MAIELNRANSTQNLSKNNSTPKQAALNEHSSAQAAQPDSSQAAKLGDSVKLSQGALELQSISDKLKQMPDINHDKVQQLKQAIDAGSYKVDSALIADKMLAFETQL